MKGILEDLFIQISLQKKKIVSIHQRNLQTPANEIYKAKNKVFLEVVNSLFEFTNKNYNLRIASVLKRKRNFTVHYGSESLLSLAPKIQELVPYSVRDVKASSFKNRIKSLNNHVDSVNMSVVHVDITKIIQGKLSLFKVVPITFIAANYFFRFLVAIKFIKVTGIVRSFHFFIQLNVLCATVYCYCFVICFYVIWPQLIMFIYVNTNQALRQIKIKLIKVKRYKNFPKQVLKNFRF